MLDANLKSGHTERLSDGGDGSVERVFKVDGPWTEHGGTSMHGTSKTGDRLLPAGQQCGAVPCHLALC